MFFQLGNNKSKACGWNDAKCFFTCYFSCQAQKKNRLPFIVVLTWFLILGKIQDSGQDDDHCWWRQRPPEASPSTKYTSSCWEGQRLSTDGKIVSKYCNISKTLGRGSINPPSPLYHGGGMNVRVRSRVKKATAFILQSASTVITNCDRTHVSL